MVERKKEHGFMAVLREGLSQVAHIVAASVFPPIAEGAEFVMKTIDARILRIEQRILRKLSSLLIIGFGGVFLMLGIFFFLREYALWSNAAAFFSIGIIVFVIGLLLKIGESERQKTDG